MQAATYAASLTVKTQVEYTEAFNHIAKLGIMPIEEPGFSICVIFIDPQEAYAVWEYARDRGYKLSLESCR